MIFQATSSTNTDNLCCSTGLTSVRQNTLDSTATGLPRDFRFPRTAMEPILAMTGNSGSWLVQDSDRQLWVLKPRYNNQHERVSINEFLGAYLARQIGLSVPAMSLMKLDDTSLWPNGLLLAGRSNNQQEMHFASAFIGSRWPGKSYDRIPANLPNQIMNASEIAGVLALDLWLRNTDSRQAIFIRYKQSNLFRVHWIDFGNCFGAASWSLSGGVKGLLENTSIYGFIQSMEQFNPWLDRINRCDLDDFLDQARHLPCSWIKGGGVSLQDLVDQLSERRKSLHVHIPAFIAKNQAVFHRWRWDS